MNSKQPTATTVNSSSRKSNKLSTKKPLKTASASTINNPPASLIKCQHPIKPVNGTGNSNQARVAGKEEEGSESLEDIQKRFELELKFCIESLEDSFAESSSSGQTAGDRRTDEKLKIYKLLKNPKTSVIRKRQVMSLLGDYRLKMAQERKQNSSATATKISNCLSDGRKSSKPKAVFVRKVNKSNNANSMESASKFTFNFNSTNQSASGTSCSSSS